MSSTRRNRRQATINSLENLESRELLTNGMKMGPEGVLINKFDYNKLIYKRQNPPPAPQYRRMAFDLPQYGPAAKAIITLYGPGTLVSNPSLTQGTPEYDAVNTHINVDGHLNILFDNTTKESQIIGKVVGTRQRVIIDEIRDAEVDPYDTTGVGTNQMGYVNLTDFNLAHGGRINFSAGVQRIFLNDIGPGSQLTLQALASPPVTSPQNPGGFNSTTTTSNSGSSAVTNNSGARTISTTVNGITVITTLPTTDQITVSNGELTGVGGLIVPGAIPSTSGNTRVEVQGVELYVKNISGYQIPGTSISGDPSNLSATRLGQEQMAGLLDVDNAGGNPDQLVVYNVNRNSSTWVVESATANNTINIVPQGGVPANTPLTLLGSGIGQYSNGNLTLPGSNTTLEGGLQVVAVGYTYNTGSGDQYWINTYSVLNGSLQGSFRVDQPFNGVGGSSGNIYVTNQTGGTNGTGSTIGYDLSASIKTGVGVPLANSTTGLSYPATFKSMAGTTGAAGISYVYDVGLQYFQPYNPNTAPDPQLGVIKMSVSGTGVLSNAGTLQAGSTSLPWSTSTKYLMGSVDQDIFIVNPNLTTSDSTGTYLTAKLYDADTLAGAGSFKIYTSAGTSLKGLSETFYPQAFGAVVVDVRGNLKTFSAEMVDNSILNVNGIANYIRIKDTSNTTIMARPVLHLAVGWKPGSNVNIISSARPTNKTPGGQERPGTRGGVRVIKTLPIIGPLTNPMQQGGF